MSGRRGFFSALKRLGSKRDDTPFFPLLPGLSPQRAEACRTCPDVACQAACPEKIIVRQEQGVVLDFSSRGCSFCVACREACTHDAFAPDTYDIAVRITIQPLECLAWHQTICRACADRCDVRAIRFEGLLHPVIDSSLCNGCGFCVGACPSAALLILPKEP